MIVPMFPLLQITTNQMRQRTVFCTLYRIAINCNGNNRNLSNLKLGSTDKPEIKLQAFFQMSGLSVF